MRLRNLPGTLLVRLPLDIVFCIAAIVGLAVSLPLWLWDTVPGLLFSDRPGRGKFLGS